MFFNRNDTLSASIAADILHKLEQDKINEQVLIEAMSALPFGGRLNIINRHIQGCPDASHKALREFAQVLDRYADKLEREAQQ